MQAALLRQQCSSTKSAFGALGDHPRPGVLAFPSHLQQLVLEVRPVRAVSGLESPPALKVSKLDLLGELGFRLWRSADQELAVALLLTAPYLVLALPLLIRPPLDTTPCLHRPLGGVQEILRVKLRWVTPLGDETASTS